MKEFPKAPTPGGEYFRLKEARDQLQAEMQEANW